MRQEAAETKALSLGTELEERSEGIKERSRRVEKMEDRLERKVKGQKQVPGESMPSGLVELDKTCPQLGAPRRKRNR